MLFFFSLEGLHEVEYKLYLVSYDRKLPSLNPFAWARLF